MVARIINGEQLASEIQTQLLPQIADLRAAGRPPNLVVLMTAENEAGAAYARNQRRACEDVGIGYELRRLPSQANESQISNAIAQLNENDAVTGVMLQLPLPAGIKSTHMQNRIDPYKDVEGISPANIGLVVYGDPIIAPCTALGVVALIDSTRLALQGAEVVIVGHSEIVGKPVQLLLLNHNATVTTCHVFTRDLAAHTRHADVLVVAAGKPGLIGADHVKDGAVVIDVGINWVKQLGKDGQPQRDPDGKVIKRICGDVQYAQVCQKAGWITPVPGGVGPMTVAMLLRNTVEAARKSLQRG